MHKISLTKQAILTILRLSGVYTLVIVTVIFVVSYLSVRSATLTGLNSEIKVKLNSYGVNPNNYPLLLKELQQKTGLQEILVIDENCTILGSTTLAQLSDCGKSIKDFYSVSSILDSKRIKVLYKINLPLSTYFRKEVSKIAVLYVSIFIVTFVLLGLFFRYFFIKPLQRVEAAVLNEDIELPKEFSFFESKIQNLKKTIQLVEVDKQYFKIAKRVVHDIRNPLLYIKLGVQNKTLTDQSLIDHLEEIEFRMSSLINSKTKNYFIIDFDNLMTSTSNEISSLFNLECETHSNKFRVQLPIHYFDLKNYLMNFARNSSEAGASSFSIRVSVENEHVVLIIEDNGQGLSPEILDTLFIESKTTKEFGNGIGLSSIYTTLLEIGGDICFNSKVSSGASFIMRLPYIGMKSNIVLIDNDKFIHASWKVKALEKGISLSSFYSVEDFFSQSRDFDFETSIYIDSDLGNDIPGEFLAKKIYDIGFKNIFLCTFFTDIDINNFPWLKGACPKQGPFGV